MATQGLFDKKMMTLAVVATVGFGFLQGARLLDLNSGPYNPGPFALVGLTFDGCTFLAVALLSYFGRFENTRKLFWVGIAVAVAYAGLIASGIQNDLTYFLMQAASGTGWSLIILCWMQVFVSYRPFHSLLMIALGYFIDTLIQPLSSALFPGQRQLVLLVVFAASAAMLYYCLVHNETVAQRMKETVAPTTSMAEAFSRTRRAVAGTLVFSAVCGFIIQIDIFSDLQYAQTDLTAWLAIGVSLAMCVVLAALKLKKANIDYICPIAALCLASILLYRSFEAGDSYLAGAMMTTFLMSFYVLLWLTFISEAYERKLPAFFLLGLALGIARLSVAGGRLLAQATYEPLGLDLHYVLIIAIWILVVTVSLIFASYLRFTSKQKAHRFDEVPDELTDPAAAEADATEGALDLLRATYGLSDREVEIIREFSAGRSARYIADYFVLSEHTVKTHLRRAYTKLGIHSRQELLDLIEEMEAQLMR
ncbi:helix-turn-helix transcriptional regulator [Raoultibacter phocaeensis]|uniref:helix-turn-helix transcriptional regulator n=1 Tax=Raoultibacter phocaeensis TaxID=2479841 RepID=UPI0011186DA8|nr:helix-turn-helix transcriptional regulator [Raoultibacter phocaeensis]